MGLDALQRGSVAWRGQIRKNRYKESLIFNTVTPIIHGTKRYEHVGGNTSIFQLRGFRGRAFDWVEYHTADGDGGGALLLRQIGAGVAKGLIIAGHCDTGALRCYANRWVAQNGPKYDPLWLRAIATDV